VAVAAALAAALGPGATGVFPRWPSLAIAGAVLGVALLLVGRRQPTPAAARLALAVGGFCLAITCADLGLRVFPPPGLYYRAHERYFEEYPPVPGLYRYTPSVTHEGETWGDLAAFTGDRALRVPRRERFVTDPMGFRNEPPGPGSPRPDLIVLGDSFGAGIGTSQERTFSTLLRERYGMPTYNLSLPGSPWHEAATLAETLPRLHVRPGTVVLWMLFAGNDLDEPYPAESIEALPRRSGPGRWVVGVRNFRRRSPLGLLLARRTRQAVGEIITVRRLAGRPVVFYLPYADRAKRTMRDIVAHPNFAGFRSAFHAAIALTRRSGLRLAVVSVPSKEEIYRELLDGLPGGPDPSPFAHVLARASEEAGVPFLDLAPALRRAAQAEWRVSGRLLWWEDDTHWNDLGHAEVARLLHEWLRRPSGPDPTHQAGE
jgi:hypothetical protein